ncbi:glycosyltransferase [Hungatella hathewayi]|uniref:glycosyltransferase n=1 Tax=Hungatella hathewayi TaxID=154046 RepID=UPI0026E32870|nr:glycosyltransferase [Hungatella hathewayi]
MKFAINIRKAKKGDKMQFDFSKQPGCIQINDNIAETIPALVSVITPYYNAAEYFEQTYYSVINQTFPWFEWIIVDDGSKDGALVLDNFQRKDSRIKVIHQTNQGQAAARNAGINASKTDIIIPLDADDLIIPTFLEVLYWALLKNPDASWCYSDSVGFQEQEYIWAKSFSVDRLTYNNFLVCTAAIRKKDLELIGGYDSSCKHYDEDWKLWLDLLSQGKYPVHINVLGFWYRRTSNGMGSQVRMDKKLKIQSDDMIRRSAQSVNKEIKAIEYPKACVTNRFLQPVLSDFSLKLPPKEKKHILMIFPWLEMGGADLFNLEIVKKLDRKNYDLTIITTVTSANTWRQRFDDYVPEIFSLPDFMDVVNYPEFVSYIIKTRRTDLIFLSNSYYGYYLLPWIRNSFPNLAVCDYVHMEEWYWRRGGYARVAGIFGDYLDKTYVCNEGTRNVLINSFGRNSETVKTLYIGVDSQYYSPKNSVTGKIYQMFDIDTKRPIVLFPCRIHPQKRPFLMLEIAREITEQGSDAAFVVVGDGPQLGELKNAVTQLGLSNTVYFAGRQEDMRPFYSDAAITLICSLKEGLALTAYESLAMGTPVITSNVGGQAELIDDSVGVVIPLLQEEAEALDCRKFMPEELNLYTTAITKLLNKNNETYYQSICKNCRTRILARFSTDLMIRKLEYEFKMLCNKSTLSVQSTPENFKIAQELATLYTEYELLETYAKNVSQPLDTKNELIRIANSKWGNRIIKIAFKLKLNKLFH